MSPAEIREKYLKFFERREHAIIPSASLVPENDPTTLFTGSGMQPLVPYLLGAKHPLGTKLVNSQKCFRAEDIEEVGDNRHTTFFEMLGNWSLGEYFKEEQLSWVFLFLVEELGLDPKRLYVTVFSGDEKAHVSKDEQSIAIWKRLFLEKGIEAKSLDLYTEERGGEIGMQGARIFAYESKKNWWSRSGTPENMPAGEPGGPDSEVFYEFESVTHDERFGKYCHPNCDCGRFMEIGNSVFMEYRKREDGSFEKLAQQNVDFGGGLERIAAAVAGNPDIFRIPLLSGIISSLEKLSGKTYGGEYLISFRIIADHIRGASFMIADGVLPSNTERGYFTRRLLRRSIRHADILGIQQGSLSSLVDAVVKEYGGVYPEVAFEQNKIREAIGVEEEKFRKTLEVGVQEFLKMALGNTISGKQAFDLYQSYGMPLDITTDLAEERGIVVDKEEFKRLFQEHRKLSREASSGMFKGGLADNSEATTKLHTAHHLLLASLQRVLGKKVKQRGSNITAERLRMDFSFDRKLTQEEIREVEDLVQEKIQEELLVLSETMPKEKAQTIGAEMEFGAKYGEMVNVYTIQDREGNVFSKEFCGGPHVTTTKDLGWFTITKEEAVSAGVRRIRATLKEKSA